MHLATDCFAFDESIHAGIFNVTAGILHGLSVIAPELQHSLIVRRPNLPPAQADWASEHGAATVLNESQADAELRENVSRFGYSHRPSFQLILNGRHLEPVTSGPDWLEWEVNEPAVRLAIASRSWIPAEILPGSSDNRELGTGVTAITLSGPFAVTSIDLDRDLGEGWYHPEPNLRWTGRTGAIPTALLAGHGLPVRIRICYLPDTYPRSRDDARNEQHVRAFRKAATTVLDDISAAGLSKRLACATAFHSHHFGLFSAPASSAPTPSLISTPSPPSCAAAIASSPFPNKAAQIPSSASVSRRTASSLPISAATDGSGLSRSTTAATPFSPTVSSAPTSSASARLNPARISFESCAPGKHSRPNIS